jgi:hypothetical protein
MKYQYKFLFKNAENINYLIVNELLLKYNYNIITRKNILKFLQENI